MLDSVLLGALDASDGLPATAANIDRVSKRFGAEAARWAFTQWELRARAKAKFAHAERMIFTREALEQASSEPAAANHASLFPEGVLVADLTAGIGGDLIALARRGPAIGFELDPERLDAARYNLAACGVDAKLRGEDCLAADWSWQYAFADPARRVGGRRTLDPGEFEPDPRLLAERFGTLSLGVQKLSPLLHDAYLESLGPSVRFVSCGGECREALVSAGSEAKRERMAVHVESGETLESGPDAPAIADLAEFFFDADPAAVRAHCLGALAQRHGLLAVGDSRGYLTGPQPIDSPWLRAYRLLYHGRADASQTHARLKSLGAASPEIKQRQANIDADKLRKLLKCEGSRRLSVAVWPLGRSLRHAILEALG